MIPVGGPRLARLLPARLQKAESLLLHAYYDDSRSDPDVMSVGGFIANTADWDGEFSEKWERFLAERGLDYFRMSEYEFGGNPPYSEWSKNERIQYLQYLIGLIRQTVRVAIFAGLSLEDFRRSADEIRRTIGITNPYHFCALHIVVETSAWQLDTRKDPWRPMNFVFELGSEGKGDLLDTFGRLSATFPDDFGHENAYIFAPKKLPGLQAADIMAYEAMKQARRVFGLDDLPPRKSLMALLAPPLPVRPILMNAEFIRDYLDGLKKHALRMPARYRREPGLEPE